MKRFLLGLGLTVSCLGWANTGPCYQLSLSANLWSRTPELMCVNEREDGRYAITLSVGMMPQTVAEFDLDLLSRARCLDCNQDVFGIRNPSNSVFNSLSIHFSGQRDANGENGTLRIGANTFYYRSTNPNVYR
jgi:hypothetical protein